MHSLAGLKCSDLAAQTDKARDRQRERECEREREKPPPDQLAADCFGQKATQSD